MLKRLMLPTLAAALVVGACAESPTAAVSSPDDYALVVFGETGSALEGTMGDQPASRPFDGRSGRRGFPPGLELSEEQIAEMRALRQAFRSEHAETLDALRAIFEEARAAHQAGATREEVRAILETARPLVEQLRPHVRALHDALRAVLTDAQREWLDSRRGRRGR